MRPDRPMDGAGGEEAACGGAHRLRQPRDKNDAVSAAVAAKTWARRRRSLAPV